MNVLDYTYDNDASLFKFPRISGFTECKSIHENILA